MKSDECYSSANPTVERRLPRSLVEILEFDIYFMVVEFFDKNVKRTQIWLIYVYVMICHIQSIFFKHANTLILNIEKKWWN